MSKFVYFKIKSRLINLALSDATLIKKNKSQSVSSTAEISFKQRNMGHTSKPPSASAQHAGTFYNQFHEVWFTDTLIMANLLILNQFKGNN